MVLKRTLATLDRRAVQREAHVALVAQVLQAALLGMGEAVAVVALVVARVAQLERMAARRAC